MPAYEPPAPERVAGWSGWDEFFPLGLLARLLFHSFRLQPVSADVALLGQNGGIAQLDFIAPAIPGPKRHPPGGDGIFLGEIELGIAGGHPRRERLGDLQRLR